MLMHVCLGYGAHSSGQNRYAKRISANPPSRLPFPGGVMAGLDQLALTLSPSIWHGHCIGHFQCFRKSTEWIIESRDVRQLVIHYLDFPLLAIPTRIQGAIALHTTLATCREP